MKVVGAIVLAGFALGCGRDPPLLDGRKPPPVLALLTLELPAGTIGQTYTASLLADGPDLEAIRWRVKSGAVPGLQLRLATGDRATLAGAPTAAGTFAIEIELTDGASTIAHMYLVQIGGGKPLAIVTESSLPTGRVDQPYVAGIRAVGGSESGYRWRISGGRFPSGLAIAPTGTFVTEISGIPRDIGTFEFTIEVMDEAGGLDRRAFEITIEDTLRMITERLPPADTNLFYFAQIEASGGSGQYSWEAFGLPSDLSIDPQGTPLTILSGVPSRPGSYDIIVRVFDTTSFVERAFELTVRESGVLQIVTESLPEGQAGVVYDTFVDTIGGTLPLNWSIFDAPLNLVGNASGQSINFFGVPETAGSYQVRFEVVDQLGQFDRRTYSLIIRQSELMITTPALADGTVGQPYAEPIEASGGSGLYSWSVFSGALPPGLSLDPSGTPLTFLTGTPTAIGSYTVIIQVTDQSNNIAMRTFTFEIDAVPTLLEIVTTALAPGTRCSGYNQEIAATGGSGSGYQWSIISPPDGLELLPAGTPSTRLLGAPRSAGTFSSTVTVTDDAGNIAFRAFTLVVAAGGSAWTVFGGDLLTDGALELFAVDLCEGTPGAPFTISSLPAGRTGGIALITTDHTQISSDRRTVAFLGDFDLADRIELYTVDLSGSTPGPRTAASGTVPVLADVNDFAWSPDGTRIVFRADLDNVAMFELYLVDIANPQPIKINGPLQPFGDVRPFYRWSPDGNRIAYRADELIDQVSELFVVDVANPGVSLRVNTDLTPGGQVDEQFLFSPDGSQLLFLAPLDSIGDADLYLASISGATPGPPIRANGPLVAGGDVRPGDFSFAPDGHALIYTADASIDESDQLFLVELTAGIPGAAVDLNPGPMPSFYDVSRAEWSPDSGRVLYVGDTTLAQIDELFMVDVSGAVPSAPVRITPSYQAGPNTSGFIPSGALGLGWSPDGRWIAFRDRVQAVTRAWVVDATGTSPSAPIRIDGSPVSTLRSAATIDFAFDSGSLTVRGDLDTDSVEELYRVSLLPIPSAPIKMSGPMVLEGDVSVSPGDVAFTEDGALLYRADQDTNGVFEIYRVDPNTPAMPVRIHAPLSGAFDTIFFRVR